MKRILVAMFALGLFACNDTNENTKALEERIEKLEEKIENTYKPGLGDFMSSIQAHHSKLWFAGQNENWDLADFEIHELMEAVEGIQEFHKGRKEAEMIEMIIPPLEEVDKAIEMEDPTKFVSSYTTLTNTCNQCHHATGYEFNVVQIPDTSPFTNQNFEISK